MTDVQRGRPQSPLHTLTDREREKLQREVERKGVAPVYRAIGISQHTLQSARNGKGLSLESYQRVLKFLGAS